MVDWKGVFPAVTTQFRADQSLDIEATMAHVERLIAAGCHGLIMLGTVGENVQLEAQEKRAVISAAVKASFTLRFGSVQPPILLNSAADKVVGTAIWR